MQYLVWREEEQHVKIVIFILLIGLPVAIWKMFLGFYGTLNGHRASAQRHFGDVAQFFTLCIILSVVFFNLLPSTEYVRNCTLEPTEDCQQIAASLRTTQLLLLILNTCMIMWDFIRYFGNRQDDLQSEVSREMHKMN